MSTKKPINILEKAITLCYTFNIVGDKMKKIGIYTGFSRDIPFYNRLCAIKSAGFNTICLNFEKELIPTETKPENQVYLANKCGLPIEAAHLTGSYANTLWNNNDTKSVINIAEEIKLLSTLQIPVGVLHVTWGLKPPNSPTKKAIENFFKITEAAEKYNVKIAFENSVSAKHLQFVLDNIKSDNIGFCYDSGHENVFTPNIDLLSLYGDRISAMHLHDNDGKTDLHLLPFDNKGTINWQEKISLLKQSKAWNNCIILEAENNDLPLNVFLENAYDSAIKLISI